MVEKNLVHQGWLDPVSIGMNCEILWFELRLEFQDGSIKSYDVSPENAWTLIQEMQGSVLELEQWYEPAYFVCLPRMGRLTYLMGTWFQVYHEEQEN